MQLEFFPERRFSFQLPKNSFQVRTIRENSTRDKIIFIILSSHSHRQGGRFSRRDSCGLENVMTSSVIYSIASWPVKLLAQGCDKSPWRHEASERRSSSANFISQSKHTSHIVSQTNDFSCADLPVRYFIHKLRAKTALAVDTISRGGDWLPPPGFFCQQVVTQTRALADSAALTIGSRQRLS